MYIFFSFTCIPKKKKEKSISKIEANNYCMNYRKKVHFDSLQDVGKLTALSREVISRQATINIGTEASMNKREI